MILLLLHWLSTAPTCPDAALGLQSYSVQSVLHAALCRAAVRQATTKRSNYLEAMVCISYLRQFPEGFSICTPADVSRGSA